MKRFTIYIPDELYDKLKALSLANYRSMNKQIVLLLKTALGMLERDK